MIAPRMRGPGGDVIKARNLVSLHPQKKIRGMKTFCKSKGPGPDCDR